jgi:hypothetical protein
MEGCFSWPKNARRFVTRYDKLFLGFVNLLAVRLWIRHFVSRT